MSSRRKIQQRRKGQIQQLQSRVRGLERRSESLNRALQHERFVTSFQTRRLMFSFQVNQVEMCGAGDRIQQLINHQAAYALADTLLKNPDLLHSESSVDPQTMTTTFVYVLNVIPSAAQRPERPKFFDEWMSKPY